MLQRLFELEREVPEWLRPTYRGALFLPGIACGPAGKLFVITILAMLALMLGFEQALTLFAALLAVGMIAGAAGGTIHWVLQPADAWGLSGTWLRWSVTIFGFVLVVVLLTPNGPFSLWDQDFDAIAAGFSVMAGGVLTLLDDRRMGRPTPRKFELLRRRERLWATARRMR